MTLHFQEHQAGLFGPKRPSSRSGLIPGLVFSPCVPVWSCVFWRPAVWLLGPLAPAEEVQHHHEAGGVWRARGDAEVSGGHSRTGNDDGVMISVEVIFPLPVIISYLLFICLSCHLKLSIPIERFTSPPEDSLPLLRLYFRSLVTGTLKRSWCPVLYVAALSHVNSFIFSQDAAAQVQQHLTHWALSCSALSECFRCAFILRLSFVSMAVKAKPGCHMSCSCSE